MTLGVDLLGRVAPPDTRHIEMFPLGVTAATTTAIEKEIPRPTLSLYNQLQTPRCVGYSISKIMNWFNKEAFDADWLYAQCKLIDGSPNEDGTSARFACDVLRSKGHLRTINGKDVPAGPQRSHGISGNRWATTVDQIRAVFATATPQPVPIGINWYQNWFQPETKGKEFWLEDPADGDGAGDIVGGHEIGIWAVSDKRQAFGLSNTWGSDWPDLVWLPYKVMTELFSQGADACVITDLPTR